MLLDNSDFLTCAKCGAKEFIQLQTFAYDIANKKRIERAEIIRCVKCGYEIEKPIYIK